MDGSLKSSSKSLRERFDAKWIPCANTGCWLWTASLDPKGYGRICLDGKNRRASIISLEFYLNRRLIKGLCALHKCDTPACVNPQHLYEGTKKQNAEDMSQRKRTGWHNNKDKYIIGQRGEKHPNSRLKESEVKEIIKMLEMGGMFQDTIAEKFGISQTTVSDLKRKRRWKYLWA